MQSGLDKVLDCASPAWSFPEGRTGFAIGDVHGRADLLLIMLERLERIAEAERLDRPVAVFLGDYIDRGPQSRQVLDLLMARRPFGFERRLLRGNHEAALLHFLSDPEGGRAWLMHGGLETLMAYDVAPPSLGASGDALTDTAQDFRQKLGAHLGLIERMACSATYGDYFFAHAGVDPTKPIEAQSQGDLLWIRQRFLSGETALSHCIVHGHTPGGEPYRDHRRVGVDTGAYVTGALTAARFDKREVSFITVRT